MRPLLPEIPAWVEQLVAERTVESENYKARKVTGQHANGVTRGASGVRAADGDGAERRDQAHTPEAAAWAGWGTALKPAFEPAVVARKPLDPALKTVAANVLAHGTGALNIDGTRIGTGTGTAKSYTVNNVTGGAYGSDNGKERLTVETIDQ